MIPNFFVSVFVGGKCVSLFYSEDLCEIHVCRLLYKGCEIEVFDIRSMCYVSSNYVAHCERIAKSRIRLDIKPQHVICVETKEIYSSLSDCASELGILPSYLASSIFSLAKVDGHHYLFESDLEGSEI